MVEKMNPDGIFPMNMLRIHLLALERGPCAYSHFFICRKKCFFLLFVSLLLHFLLHGVGFPSLGTRAKSDGMLSAYFFA